MSRFDEAWAAASSFVAQHLALGERAVLVRDLYARIIVALDDRNETAGLPSPEERQRLATTLDRALGAFSPGVDSIFLLASKMFAPEEIFGTSDAIWADPASRSHRILDRNLVGADWLRVPFESQARRITLYGVKGGVGRSTAAAVLAWRLSEAGRRVLVLDLDLESPGIGSTLLPANSAPDYGVVDWLVEDAVGQGDPALLADMAAPSPLGSGGAEIVVVPANGRLREGYTYLPKLARSYLDLSKDGRLEGFGDRLHRLLGALEKTHRPDVTLLDSRAGLHDIAALTVTRLGATSLLFAVDTSQTWQAYQMLFRAWRAHSDLAERFRENLKIIAAHVPETETLSYLASFQQRSYDLFAENLYVETPAGEIPDFNFDLNDPAAPHTPLRIHWSRAFQQFDPINQPGAVTDEQIRAAYGDFISGVTTQVFGEPLS